MNNHTFFPLMIFTLFCLLHTANAQNNNVLCNYLFEENNPTVSCGAIQSVQLSNGDPVVAGFHPIQGNAAFVIERYGKYTCGTKNIYMVTNDVSYDSTLQLITTKDDRIFIRYKGTDYYTIVQLDSNLNMLNSIQFSVNGYPDLKIATDYDGNLLCSRKKINTSFNFDLQVLKFNGLDFSFLGVTNISVPNCEFISITDMISDTSGNVYITGYMQHLLNQKTKTYLVKIENNGGTAWTDYFDEATGINKLCIDEEQSILIASKNPGNSQYHLNIYKYNTNGILQWHKSKNYGSLNFEPAWITTDSSCNVYAASCKTGTTPYLTTRLFKFDKYGNQAWEKSIPNLKPAALKAGNNGQVIAIAGSRFVTLQNDSSYRAYFRTLDATGNMLYDFIDGYSPGANPLNSYFASYNDLELHDDLEEVFVIGKRIYYNHYAGTRNFYIAREINLFNPNNPKSSGVEHPEDFRVEVKPNPATDFIDITVPTGHPYEIEINDQIGKTLYKSIHTNGSARIDLRFYIKGVYFVTLKSHNINKSIKCIKM